MGNVCKETNEHVFVMDYLWRCTTSPLCHFTFCWSKKIFFICIKSPSCPYKNDSIHSVRLWHLLGLKIKMLQIFQKFMIFARSRNYSARGLKVKYVKFVLISIIYFYLSLGSSLSEKPGHIKVNKTFGLGLILGLI